MDANYHASGRHPVLSAGLALSCAIVVMQGLNTITLRQTPSPPYSIPFAGSLILGDSIAVIPAAPPCVVAVPILPPNFERDTQMAGKKLRPNLWPTSCLGEIIDRKDDSSIVRDCGSQSAPYRQHCNTDTLFE